MSKLCFKNFYSLLVTLLIAFNISLPATASDQAPALVAGEVIFAVGDAYVVSLSGPQKATVGAMVLAGDRLVTGVNGYVHLRMSDGAFLGVRSDSLLEINEYMFDTTQPQNGRVRLFLKEGTVRAISGRIAHENKQNFRLNTPLAAIGVRGTDFVTAVDQHNTQVAVTAGGVSMAPYGAQCIAAELGSCLGANVIDLFAEQANSLLVVKQGQAAAQVISGDIEALFAPAHPQEQNDSSLNLTSAGPVIKDDESSHILTFVLQKILTEQEIKALSLLPADTLAVAQELVQIDTLELVRLSNAVGAQQAYRQTLDRKVVNIADRAFNIVTQSQPLLRFYDQTGMLAWSATADGALFDERIIYMKKDQSYKTLMNNVGLGVYLQGFGMEDVQADATIEAWNTYYSNHSQAPIAQIGASNLYHATGLKALKTPALNDHYPAVNLAYTSADARVLNADAGIFVDNVVLKINHKNGVFEAKITLNDVSTAAQEYRIRGSLNASGMLFGGNENVALEGLVINATGQIATIVHYQNANVSKDVLVLFDNAQLSWPELELVAAPALFKTTDEAPINWGRWEHYDPLDDQVIDRLHLANLDLVAKNSHFALFQPVTAAHAMPIGDSFNFALGSYEALHVAEGGTTTATLKDAKLNINFLTAQYATQMEVIAPRLLAPIHLFSKGEVSNLGRLSSHAQDSNMNVAGMVTDQANSVGMLLEHSINATSSVVAAMEWLPE